MPVAPTRFAKPRPTEVIGMMRRGPGQPVEVEIMKLYEEGVGYREVATGEVDIATYEEMSDFTWRAARP